MTDTVVLKAEPRTNGSKKAAAVRAQGLLPAVIYGHKQESKSVSVELKGFVEGLHSGHRLFELEFDGSKETLLVKQVQYDYLGKDIIHVDFIRVDLNEKANVSVPLTFKGSPKGAAEGGILDIHFDSIEINCPVTSIPESIAVKVKALGLGDAVLAKDIELPSGASLITDANAVIVNCHVVTEKPEPVEGEEMTEPEVITEKNTDKDKNEA